MQVDESVARKKDEMALKLAVGEINVLQSEDVFEGLTPKVCYKLVQAHWPMTIDPVGVVS